MGAHSHTNKITDSVRISESNLKHHIPNLPSLSHVTSEVSLNLGRPPHIDLLSHIQIKNAAAKRI